MIGLLRFLSWPELRHHPWRHVAALLAVTLGVALAFSVQLINASALNEFSSAVRSVNGEPDFEIRGGVAGFDETLYARVAHHAQVALASPVIELDATAIANATAGEANDARGQPIALHLIGIDALAAAPLAPALLPQPASGADRFAPFDPQALFLNPAARQRLGASGTVTLHTATGQATLQTRGGVAARGPPLAVMDLAGVQGAFGWLGRLSRIDVRLAAGADRAQVVRELALPPGLRAAAPDEATERVSNVSRAYRVNLTVLALVALFTGAFLVFSILSLSVAKRAPQLALLGVLGLSAGERLRLVLAESALLGAAGSVLGLALGTGLAAAGLRWLAGDLGGGYFPGVAPALQFGYGAAAVYGLLGVAAALVGGWLPARAAQQLAPAQALKGLGSGSAGRSRPWTGPLLLGVGVGLALLPPVAGIALAAYIAVACLLLGGIACVPAGVGALLRLVAPSSHALVLLAVERARHQRHTATIAVAGVVASLALAVALTVMVASFRDAVTQWLDTVLPADLYVRTTVGGNPSDLAALPPELARRAALMAGVARLEVQRVAQIQLDPQQPAVALIARPLADPARGLPLVGELLPLPPGATAAYVSEAFAALYHAAPGQSFALPLPLPLSNVVTTVAASAASNPTAGSTLKTPDSAAAPTASSATVFVRGVWRDYARQHGAVLLDSADYLRLTGDRRIDNLALWLAPGANPGAVQQALRRLAADVGADAGAIEFASAGDIRTLSLRIFDRSFAVTYWLQAVAIAIGLFGIAASFSAQVLARRKEFGLLAHLGLTRRQVLTVVATEGAVWTAAGALVGLGLGLAVSVVLVKVVNPQSFHWSMDLLLPWARLAALCAAVVGSGTLTAWLAARRAAGGAMALAVKEDW